MEDVEEVWFSMMPFMYFRSQVHHHSVWRSKTLPNAMGTPQQISKSLIMPKYINIEKIYTYGMPDDSVLDYILKKKP